MTAALAHDVIAPDPAARVWAAEFAKTHRVPSRNAIGLIVACTFERSVTLLGVKPRGEGGPVGHAIWVLGYMVRSMEEAFVPRPAVEPWLRLMLNPASGLQELGFDVWVSLARAWAQHTRVPARLHALLYDSGVSADEYLAMNPKPSGAALEALAGLRRVAC